MSIRIFSDVSNNPIIAMESKKVTRASRKVLGEITSRNIPRTVVGFKRKSNIVGNLRLGQRKALRQTKVGAKGALNGPIRDEQKQIPMEVEQQSDVEPRRIPEGVTDIDEEDAANPQLCAEYAQEIYAYLKYLEKKRSVRSDFLSGCPITDKMRAVLVDWLVEVQMQFKLLQETLFLTVNTIDR